MASAAATGRVKQLYVRSGLGGGLVGAWGPKTVSGPILCGENEGGFSVFLVLGLVGVFGQKADVFGCCRSFVFLYWIKGLMLWKCCKTYAEGSKPPCE